MDSDTNTANSNQSINPDYLKARMNECAVARANPRQLIDDRINYHNRMVNGLHALLRQMPAEMSFQAEEALAQLIIESKPKW